MGSFFIDLLSFDHEVAVFEKDPLRMRFTYNCQRFTTYDEVEAFRPELLINAVTLKYTIPVFKEVIPYAQKGKIKDIVFKGNALEVKLDVEGMEMICHRSMERRGIVVGEEMNVIVYRLYAIKGEFVELQENFNLKAADPEGELMEKYLYGDGNAFAAKLDKPQSL